jgi:hypothetical protein
MTQNLPIFPVSRQLFPRLRELSGSFARFRGQRCHMYTPLLYPQRTSLVGHVVRVRPKWFPFIWHYGIIVDATSGELLVTHCSVTRGVIIETLSEFREGEKVELCGFPGQLAAWQVINRAKARIGAGWDPIRFNCEHFWREAHGLEPESPQLQATVFWSVIALGCALLRKSEA